MKFDAGENTDRANLAGAGDVRPAAGADIVAGDGHDADLTGQLLLAAVRDRFQFLRRGICDLDGQILPDGFICLALQHRQLRVVQHAVEVDRHKVCAHVEADIFIAEVLVDQAA